MSFVHEAFRIREEFGAEPEGFIPGEIIHITPRNQRISFSLTGPLGKPNGTFFNLLFSLSKSGFVIKKTEEWTEVSPVHAQYYQLTIQQKQQLEQQIKAAMASIQTAVADYELLAHDLRKYKEFLQYFEGIEQGKKEKKPEMVLRNNQTLKAIFIDQVDAHTGEGIALRNIAARWPTIIVDFMRLKDEDVDPKKIAENYGFTEAEGVVLATKNKLFVQWKELFRKTVTERYQRLLQLAESRKKSIEEYRDYVRPYINRYRSIRELGETSVGRELLRAISWFRPSGQAVSVELSEYWAWKNFVVPEPHKASIEAPMLDKEVPIMKAPFPKEFKEAVLAEYERVKSANFEKVKLCPNGIEPLDKFVLFFIFDEKVGMQKFYRNRTGIKDFSIDIIDILKARDNLIKDIRERGWYNPYYAVVEMRMLRTILRYPDGTEEEDLSFDPIQTVLDSQNSMLLRYLELLIIEKEAESYITEFLGETLKGKKLEDVLKETFPLTFGGEKKEAKPSKPIKIKITPRIFKFFHVGPYETNFVDRIAAPYFKTMAPDYYQPVLNILKRGAGVP
jgi:hypothetical protein